MIRSLLFVPGDDARKLDKAAATIADALILDLEDAVSLDRKLNARKLTSEWLRAAQRDRQKFFVRINALDTELALNDLAAIMPARPDGIVLPKCRSAAQVRQLTHYLEAFEAAHGLPADTQILGIVTETADSVLALANYGDCGPRLWGMLWGGEDLSASLGATQNRLGEHMLDPYRLARALCLLAASAAGVVAVDAVNVDIDNLQGLQSEAEEARRDGFTAKAVIHPKHINIVNAAFSPSAADISKAQRIVDAFADYPASGVIQLDGKMIDKPHLRLAERLLKDAQSFERQKK